MYVAAGKLRRSGVLLPEEADKLADPEYERGRADYYYPVDKFERLDIKEIASYRHDKYLTQKDKQRYQSETAAPLEVEGRTSGLEGAGVEHIPELEEDEDRKEE